MRKRRKLLLKSGKVGQWDGLMIHHRRPVLPITRIEMADMSNKTKRLIKLFSDEAMEIILRNTPRMDSNELESWRDHFMDQVDDEADYCDATEADIY